MASTQRAPRSDPSAEHALRTGRSLLLGSEHVLRAFVYFCAARVALLLAFERTNASPFWPPAGIALLAFMFRGPRAFPGIMLGAFAANLVTFIANHVDDWPTETLVSAVLGFGNASAALLGWAALGRPRIGRDSELSPPLARRLALAAIVAAATAATLGSATLVAVGLVPRSLWTTVGRIWLLGDAVGIVLVIPLALSWWSGHARKKTRVSSALPYGLMCALAFLLLQSRTNATATWLTPLLLLPIAISIVRGSRREMWSTAMCAATLLIWETTRNIGPCAASTDGEAMLRLQLVLLVGAGGLSVLDALWLSTVRHDRADEGVSQVLELLQSEARFDWRPAVATTGFGVLIAVFAWLTLDDVRQQALNRDTREVAEFYATQIDVELQNIERSITRQAERWVASGGTDEELWRKDALSHTRDMPYLRAVEWVDPQGIVRWVEPHADDARVIGLDLSRQTDRSSTLERARSGRRAVFSPVLELVQGYYGVLLVTALPADEGFLIGVVDLERLAALVRSASGTPISDTYALELTVAGRTIHPATPSRSKAPLAGPFQEHATRMLPTPLHVRLAPRTSRPQDDALPAMVLSAGVLLSTLLGLGLALVQLAVAHARLANVATAAKARFLATMSHEIRTPMNGILGATELALEEATDPTLRGHLAIIKFSGRALLAILNDILDFSKVESGKLALESVPMDLAEVTEQSVALLAPNAAARGIALQYDYAQGVPRVVLGDPARIRQILLNLLGNAIKFTERGHVRLQVTKLEDAHAPRIRLTCEDTGVGIAREQLKAVFQPFVQADASMTRKFGGTGLGLAIVQQLVTEMRGSIRCDSEPGRGTTFVVELPLLETTEAPEQAPALATPTPATMQPPSLSLPAARSAQAPAAGARRVLLAEDNPVNQRVVSALLERLGCAVVIAGDGAEAVSRFEQEPYDLVLLDVHMPVLDGLAACVRMRESERGHKTPILALTASAYHDDEARCLEAGMDGFLSKPVSLEELRTALRNFASHGRDAAKRPLEASTG